jgi:hypothetical protein
MPSPNISEITGEDMQFNVLRIVPELDISRL